MEDMMDRMMLLMIVGSVINLCVMGCWVFVLVKSFQSGILHGLVGFLFAPYTFIWGWLNAGRLKIIDVMLFWSFLMVLSFALGLAFMQAGATLLTGLGDGSIPLPPLEPPRQ